MFEKLPEEILHEIFCFLDYVGDLHRCKKLMIPQFNLSEWTKEEFEHLIRNSTNDDDDGNVLNVGELDVNYDKGLLLLTCKAIYQAIKRFKPLSLHFKVYGKINRKKVFEIDIYKSKNDRVWKNIGNEWEELIKEFVENIGMFTNSVNIFENVEHVELWSCKPNLHSTINLNELMMNYFPNIKVLNTNISGKYFNNILPNYRLVEFGRNVANNFVGPTLHTSFRTTRIQVDDLDRILSPGYICNIELFLMRAIETQAQHVVDYILKRFHINIEYFMYLFNIQRREFFPDEANFKNTLEILCTIHKKYPKFKLFVVGIPSLKYLKTIQNHSFISIDISNNLKLNFVKSIYSDENLKETMTSQFGVDLSEWEKLLFQ